MKTNKAIFSLAFMVIATPLFWASGAQAQTAVSHKFIVDTTVNATAEAVDAVPAFDVQVVKDIEQKFILVVNNPRAEKINITMLTPTGDKHSDKTSLSTFRRRYDLAGADAGKYTIRVTNGKKTISRKIEFNSTTQVSRTIEVE